jgi:hypothetical protein
MDLEARAPCHCEVKQSVIIPAAQKRGPYLPEIPMIKLSSLSDYP